MKRINLYTVSYDNFYLSNDIVDVNSVDYYINEQIKLVKNGNFSGLFCCNDIEDYRGFELTQKDNNDFELTLLFNENDFNETYKVTLIKSNLFSKGF